MDAGRLDRRAVIQRATVTRDAYGGAKETWEDWKTLACEVRGLSGREFWAAAQTQAERVLVFRFRFLSASGVTTADRIRYEGDDYDILDIRELGRREVLEVRAQGRVE